jgi:hypothetical protein
MFCSTRMPPSGIKKDGHGWYNVGHQRLYYRIRDILDKCNSELEFGVFPDDFVMDSLMNAVFYARRRRNTDDEFGLQADVDSSLPIIWDTDTNHFTRYMGVVLQVDVDLNVIRGRPIEVPPIDRQILSLSDERLYDFFFKGLTMTLGENQYQLSHVIIAKIKGIRGMGNRRVIGAWNHFEKDYGFGFKPCLFWDSQDKFKNAFKSLAKSEKNYIKKNADEWKELVNKFSFTTSNHASAVAFDQAKANGNKNEVIKCVFSHLSLDKVSEPFRSW